MNRFRDMHEEEFLAAPFLATLKELTSSIESCSVKRFLLIRSLVEAECSLLWLAQFAAWLLQLLFPVVVVERLKLTVCRCFWFC